MDAAECPYGSICCSTNVDYVAVTNVDSSANIYGWILLARVKQWVIIALE